MVCYGVGRGWSAAKNVHVPAAIKENPFLSRLHTRLEQALAKQPQVVTPEVVTPEGVVYKVEKIGNATLLSRQTQKARGGAKETAKSVAGKERASVQKAVKCAKDVASKEADAVSLIPKFISENRVPKDWETILSHPSFKRTKKTFQQARIYKKDNLYYYRDQFHKGRSAHLEVFTKRGVHLGEVDPLTGKLIPNTADTAKKLAI